MLRVVRVALNEFELEDGSVFPIDPPLTEEMTPDEFQEHYEYAVAALRGHEALGGHPPDTEGLGQGGEDRGGS